MPGAARSRHFVGPGNPARPAANSCADARVTARASLRVVDEATGELHDSCPGCVKLEHEITVLQKKMRGVAGELGEALADRRAKAEASEYWGLAARLFLYWKRACRHERAEWSWQRFELCLPYIQDGTYGLEMCLRAIAGARFDPFTRRRKNGSVERYDSWELIFRDHGKFESFCNRAPRGWVLPSGAAVVLERRR